MQAIDVACIQCEHSCSQQKVPFAFARRVRVDWLGMNIFRARSFSQQIDQNELRCHRRCRLHTHTCAIGLAAWSDAKKLPSYLWSSARIQGQIHFMLRLIPHPTMVLMCFEHESCLCESLRILSLNFVFRVFAELIGSTKRLNVNFQDQDG